LTDYPKTGIVRELVRRPRKPLRWIASARDDRRDFRKKVRREIGGALNEAQLGGKHPKAKPLKGFRGSGVVEVAEDYDGDTYRAVYTVRWLDSVYVLHAFQKKSKRGIETPKSDLDLIRRRIKLAEEDQQHRRGTK
jgi:phage-related protein